MNRASEFSEYKYLHGILATNMISQAVIIRLRKYAYFKTLLRDASTTPMAIVESLIRARLDALEEMFERVHSENKSLVVNSINDLVLVNPQILYDNLISIKGLLRKIVEINRLSAVKTLRTIMDPTLLKYGAIDHKVFLKEIDTLLDYSDLVVDLFYNIDKKLDAPEVYAYLVNGLTKSFWSEDLCKNPDNPCYFEVGMLGKYFYLGKDPSTDAIVIKNNIIQGYKDVEHELPEVDDLENKTVPFLEKLLERIGGLSKRIRTIPRHLDKADVTSMVDATRWLLGDNEDIRKILGIIDFMNSNLSTKAIFLNEYMDYIKQTVELRTVNY